MGDVSKERHQTGNHCRVYMTGDDAKRILGDGVFGGAVNKGQNTNVSSSTGAREVYIVGDPDPVEIVDTQHAYTCRIDLLRLRQDDSAQLMMAGAVDIEVIDKYNSKVVAVVQGAKIADINCAIPANQLVVRNVTFRGMRVTGG